MDVIFHFSTLLVLFTVVIHAGLAEGECTHSCISKLTCNHKKVGLTCYYVFKNVNLTWQNSRSFCMQQDLSMVKITREMLRSRHEVIELFPHIPYPRDGVWLGGKAEDLDNWQFLNSTKAKGSRFLEGVFATGNGDSLTKCGMMYFDSTYVDYRIEFEGKNVEFETNNCYSKKYFTCRLDQPEDEIYLTLVRENKTWFEAREYCLDLGGDLFYLKGSEMKDRPFRLDLAPLQMGNLTEYFHVGLRRRRWKWVDGTEILYTNWDNNQPDLFYERCLMMYGDTGKWNDDWCQSKKLVACQGDIETSGSTDLSPRSRDITPTQAMHTEKVQPGGILITGSSHLTVPPTESGKSASKSKSNVAIILGALLGASFLIACALTGFLLCRKYRKKASNTETEIVENPYYETSVESDTGNQMTQNSTDCSMVTSTGVAMDTGSYSNIDQLDTEPGTKTKKIFGPLTGDIYTLPGK